MDWDKLRIFQAAADAGSFTHAGETLGLSQSAVSRQVGALEADLGTPLFHRHARGLILTEQGEMLLGAVRDVVLKLDAVRSRLIDSREKPTGELRITSPLGLGANWLAPRLGEFVDLYPEVKLQLLLSDDELDIGMREADVALRLREPSQPDLIRRRLFTVHFHAYASAEYLKKRPQPRKPEDLDYHHLVAFGAADGDPPALRPQFAARGRARPEESARAADRRQQPQRHGARGGERRRHRGAARLCRAARLEPRQAVAAGRHAADGLFPGVRRRDRRPSRAFRRSATFSSPRRSAGDTEATLSGEIRIGKTGSPDFARKSDGASGPEAPSLMSSRTRVRINIRSSTRALRPHHDPILLLIAGPVQFSQHRPGEGSRSAGQPELEQPDGDQDLRPVAADHVVLAVQTCTILAPFGAEPPPRCMISASGLIIGR